MHFVEFVVSLFGQVGTNFILGEEVIRVVYLGRRFWSSRCVSSVLERRLRLALLKTVFDEIDLRLRLIKLIIKI